MFASLIAQFNRNRNVVILLYVIAIGSLLTVYLGNQLFGIPVDMLMRDTSSLANVAPWTGFISNVGILFWCAATTLCWAATAVPHQPNLFPNRLFFLVSGLLSAFLTLDDFFVLHESFRDYLGFPERAFFALYLIFFGLYFWKYGRAILKTDFLLLLLAFAFLGTSLSLDNFQDHITRFVPYSYYYFVEDGLKLVGIISWFGYFALLFKQSIDQFAHTNSAVTQIPNDTYSYQAQE